MTTTKFVPTIHDHMLQHLRGTPGIRATYQKYYPEYRDRHFKRKCDFTRWLRNRTAYVLEFQDDGQDFLTWYLDKGGEVLHCEPFQSAIWNGKIVDVSTLGLQYVQLIDADRERNLTMSHATEQVREVK